MHGVIFLPIELSMVRCAGCGMRRRRACSVSLVIFPYFFSNRSHNNDSIVSGKIDRLHTPALSVSSRIVREVLVKNPVMSAMNVNTE